MPGDEPGISFRGSGKQGPDPTDHRFLIHQAGQGSACDCDCWSRGGSSASGSSAASSARPGAWAQPLALQLFSAAQVERSSRNCSHSFATPGSSPGRPAGSGAQGRTWECRSTVTARRSSCRSKSPATSSSPTEGALPPAMGALPARWSCLRDDVTWPVPDSASPPLGAPPFGENSRKSM